MQSEMIRIGDVQIEPRPGWKITGKDRPELGMTQMRVEFPNGYEVSIVRGPYTHGGPEGLFEGAVMHGDSIVYDTPLTDDVRGHMTAEEALKFVADVAALPPRG